MTPEAPQPQETIEQLLKKRSELTTGSEHPSVRQVEVLIKKETEIDKKINKLVKKGKA